MKNNKFIFLIYSYVVFALSCNNNDVESYNNLEKLFQNKHYSEFIEETNLIIESNDLDSAKLHALYYKRSISLYKLNRFDEALSNISLSLLYNDKQYESFLLKAQIFESLANADSAILYYDKCIDCNNKADICFNNRGLLFYNYKEMFDKALSDFNNAIRINENSSFYFNNKGLALEEMSKPDSAIFYYNIAIGLDSLNSIIYYNKSVSLFSIKDTIGALNEINKAVNLSPNSDMLLFNRGLLFIKLNQYEKACSDLNLSLKFGNKDAKSFILKYCNINFTL